MDPLGEILKNVRIHGMATPHYPALSRNSTYYNACKTERFQEKKMPRISEAFKRNPVEPLVGT